MCITKTLIVTCCVVTVIARVSLKTPETLNNDHEIDADTNIVFSERLGGSETKTTKDLLTIPKQEFNENKSDRFEDLETKTTEDLLTIPKVEEFNGNVNPIKGGKMRRRRQSRLRLNFNGFNACVMCDRVACPSGYVSINGECFSIEDIKASG